MRFTEAEKMMKLELRTGFIVEWERRESGMLCSDYTPDVRNGEEPFRTESEAWEWARRWATTMGTRRIVNVYVAHASDFTPVAEYSTRMLNKH
jgi:hypothetical protein